MFLASIAVWIMPRASTTKADTPTKAATKEIKAAKALKKQLKEDKPKVKRAPSPYIVFCTEKRPEAKEANPEATFGMLGKILGQMWGELDEAGKAVRYQIIKGFDCIIRKTLRQPISFNFLSIQTAIREGLRREEDSPRKCLRNQIFIDM